MSVNRKSGGQAEVWKIMKVFEWKAREVSTNSNYVQCSSEEQEESLSCALTMDFSVRYIGLRMICKKKKKDIGQIKLKLFSYK